MFPRRRRDSCKEQQQGKDRQSSANQPIRATYSRGLHRQERSIMEILGKLGKSFQQLGKLEDAQKYMWAKSSNGHTVGHSQFRVTSARCIIN